MKAVAATILIIGKAPPSDPEADGFGISAISTREFMERDVKEIAAQYRFVLVHKSVDVLFEGNVSISTKLVREMPDRVGFVSAGGEASGSYQGFPVLGRMGSSDDVVRAARRASLSASFKGNIEELVELLAQAVPEWGANLRACAILLQGLWALSLEEAKSCAKDLSEPAMQCCSSLGFSPCPKLPVWTGADRNALVQGFLATVQLLGQAPPRDNGGRGSDWASVTEALSELKVQLTPKDVEWSGQSFIDSLVKATEGIARVSRKYLD